MKLLVSAREKGSTERVELINSESGRIREKALNALDNYTAFEICIDDKSVFNEGDSYDWVKLMEDKVPCYFFPDSTSSKYEYDVGILCICNFTCPFPFNTNAGEYSRCEPIRTEDKLKYLITE